MLLYMTNVHECGQKRGRMRAMAKKKPSGVGRQWLYDLMEKPVGRLYVLYGEETFRRDAAVGILKNRLVDPSLEMFNYRAF